MDRTEKRYIISECKKHYCKALLFIENQNKKDFLVELGKARVLKEIVEKFFDCQSKNYRETYRLIVAIENKIRRAGW